MSPRLPALAALLAATALPAAAAPLYSIVDLGFTNEYLSIGNAISPSGIVAGTSIAPDGTKRAFRTGASGAPQPLPGNTGTNSYGQGINDAGQVVGWGVFDGRERGFLSNPDGSFQVIGTFGGASAGAPGAPGSYANAINASGRIAGYAVDDTLAGRAFRTGVAGDLQHLGSDTTFSSYAFGINDNGQVTGYGTGPGPARAFRTDAAGTIQFLQPADGSSSVGRAINAAGDVAGYRTAAVGEPTHAFLATTEGEMIDLLTLGGLASMAFGINAARDVVGNAGTSDGGQAGFLYSGGTMYDLNDLLDSTGSGWNVLDARAINDNGQITGLASHFGQNRAFLMTLSTETTPPDNPPPDTPPTDMPEPPALLAMLGGLALLVRQRRQTARG